MSRLELAEGTRLRDETLELQIGEVAGIEHAFDVRVCSVVLVSRQDLLCTLSAAFGPSLLDQSTHTEIEITFPFSSGWPFQSCQKCILLQNLVCVEALGICSCFDTVR